MLLAAQPKPALALLQKTLSNASALPPGEPLRIRLEMNHAAALSALGDRKTARAALESLYDRSRKARGERDPTTMEVENNLAILLGRMGEARLRSEEHTSELQSLMRISYAVFCLKKKKTNTKPHNDINSNTIPQ